MIFLGQCLNLSVARYKSPRSILELERVLDAQMRDDGWKAGIEKSEPPPNFPAMMAEGEQFGSVLGQLLFGHACFGRAIFFEAERLGRIVIRRYEANIPSAVQ